MDSVLQHLADRFEIKGALGSGAFATVYRAFDKSLEREVALKILHRENSMDPDAQLRFEREAKALCSLNHPNIVQVLSFGVCVGAAPYMVSELLTGQSLRQRLLDGALMPVDEVRRIALQVCKGLDFMHEGQFIHRDIKPENLFICDNGTVKLIDLGLCGFAPGSAAGQMSLTRTGMVVGTVSYMSPEQVRGEELDGRSDLYSLGCVIYECLAGQPPFTADDTMALMVQHNSVEADWQFLSKSAPAGSGSLIEVVRTALRKERTSRFESAQVMGNAISAHSYRSKSIWTLPTVPRKVAVLVIGGLAASMIAVTIVISQVIPKSDDGECIELPHESNALKASRCRDFVSRCLREQRLDQAIVACQQFPLSAAREKDYCDALIFTSAKCMVDKRFLDAHALLLKLDHATRYADAREVMRSALAGVEQSNRELALELIDSDIRKFTNLKLPPSEILSFELLHLEMLARRNKLDERLLKRLNEFADLAREHGLSDSDWRRLNQLYIHFVATTDSTVDADNYLQAVPASKLASASIRSSFDLVRAQCAVSKHHYKDGLALFNQARAAEPDMDVKARIDASRSAAIRREFSADLVPVRVALDKGDVKRCIALIKQLRKSVGRKEFAAEPLFSEDVCLYVRLLPADTAGAESDVRQLVADALQSNPRPDWRPAIYRSLAIRQASQGLYKQSLKTAQVALEACKERDPSMSSVWVVIGSSALKMKKYDLSERAFRNGIDSLAYSHTRHKSMHGPNLYLGLSDTLIATARPEEAVKILTSELELNPSNPYRQELSTRLEALRVREMPVRAGLKKRQ